MPPGHYDTAIGYLVMFLLPVEVTCPWTKQKMFDPKHNNDPFKGNHNQQATNTTTIVKHKQKEACKHGKLHSTLKRYSFHTSLPDVPQSPLLCRSLGSPTVSLRNMSKSASLPSTIHRMSAVLFKLACRWRCMWKTAKLWSENLILKPWVKDHVWTDLVRLYRMERMSKASNGAQNRNVKHGNLAEGLVLLWIPSCNGLGRGIEIWQASLVGLDWPLSAVAIAREDHMLVLFENLTRLLDIRSQNTTVFGYPVRNQKSRWIIIIFVGIYVCWKGKNIKQGWVCQCIHVFMYSVFMHVWFIM